MRRYLGILAMATMVACSGSNKDDTTDTDGPAGDDDDAECTVSVVDTFPAADDTDVYYKTDVRVVLSTEDTAATIAVVDAGGAAVAGTTTVDSVNVTWDGSADLAPNTSYTATVTHACGETTFAFTTSDTGLPTDTDITDLVYELDLASGEWVQPPNVGDLIASQLGGVQILVSPKAVTATEITMIGALGDGSGNQDVCQPSLDFGQAAAWTDPYFELSSPLLTLEVAGVSADIEDLVLAGAFAPNGSRIQGATLQGAIDTRPLASLFGTGTDACALIAIFGVSCEPCSDGSGTFCLSVNVDNINALQVVGAAPIVPIVQADIDANPNCQ